MYTQSQHNYFLLRPEKAWWKKNCLITQSNRDVRTKKITQNPCTNEKQKAINELPFNCSVGKLTFGLAGFFPTQSEFKWLILYNTRSLLYFLWNTQHFLPDLRLWGGDNVLLKAAHERERGRADYIGIKGGTSWKRICKKICCGAFMREISFIKLATVLPHIFAEKMKFGCYRQKMASFVYSHGFTNTRWVFIMFQ